MYRKVADSHRRLLADLQSVRQATAAGRVADLPELADQVLAMKECQKLADDQAKDLQKVVELTERTLCLLWAQGTSGEPIRTEHTTVTPRVKMAVQLPKQRTDPEGYAAIMGYFGVNKLATEGELLRAHWPSMVEHVSELLSAGKPLPPGIDPSRTYPVYATTARKKKEVVDLTLEEERGAEPW